MDVSELYIKMCGEAMELQAAIPEPTTSVLNLYALQDTKTAGLEEIWLPRQDQLQQMFSGSDLNRNAYALISRIFCWKRKYEENIKRKSAETSGIMSPQFHTMEQLWLACLMDEQYGKRWVTLENRWEFINTENHYSKEG